MLSTYNKILEAQIGQQAISSSTPPGGLPSKREPNPQEQCNCIILRGGLEGSEGARLEERDEVINVVSERMVNEHETLTLGEECNIPVSNKLLTKLK